MVAECAYHHRGYISAQAPVEMINSSVTRACAYQHSAARRQRKIKGKSNASKSGSSSSKCQYRGRKRVGRRSARGRGTRLIYSRAKTYRVAAPATSRLLQTPFAGGALNRYAEMRVNFRYLRSGAECHRTARARGETSLCAAAVLVFHASRRERPVGVASVCE